MNTDRFRRCVSRPRAAALCAGGYLLLSTVAFPQGSLIPPGAPTPTMKSLDQVEPRLIVNTTNTPGNATNTFIISAPGSYYLTGNITGASGKHGISIQADDVTLDLNGFALISGGGGAFRGINVPVAKKNLCLRNGTIRGWTDGGVRTDLATSTLVEKLRLSDNTGATGLVLGNGSAQDCAATGNDIGFFLGNGAQITGSSATANIRGFAASDRTQISNCISTVNSGSGFDCTSYVTLIDCTSSRNGGNGIAVQSGSIVLRCSATRNDLYGIQAAGVGSTIADCTAATNTFVGIWADSGDIVRGCTSSGNTQNGIYVNNGRCHVVGNLCHANGTNGMYIAGDGSRVEDNNLTYNMWGMQVVGANNIIVRNTARGNSSNNFLIPGTNNAVGTIFVVSGGGTISTMEPWCNFSF